MNCKQGDMALVVRSAAGNIGKSVTCLEYVRNPGIIICGEHVLRLADGDWWRIDRALNFMELPIGMMYPDCVALVPDSYLMPINGGDLKERETDEVLPSVMRRELEPVVG